MTKLFLSYAREDRNIADQIYYVLRDAGFLPFMDVQDILPGENWSEKIQDAIKDSDFFLAIISTRSVNKRGFLQKELHLGLGVWEYMLENDIYLIPIRIDECTVPKKLSNFQWVDWFSKDGHQKLIDAINIGSKRRGIALEKPNSIPHNTINSSSSEVVLAKKIKYPITIDFLQIPLGDVLVGSDPKKDKNAQVDEQPQFTVFVEGFWIGKYLVTNKQYANFVKESGYITPSQWVNGQYASTKANHPVVGVSWLDSVAFCDWLSFSTGKKFRLPTEFEWEKVARGSDGRIFPWGDKWSKDKLNCLENKIGDTSEVGAFFSLGDNPYNVCDMVGNVWEWCNSIYQPYPYSQKEDHNQTIQSTTATRVIRGGSFASSKNEARCACRNRYAQDFRFGLVGFRVAASEL